MADIHLSAGNDTYVQAEADRDIYNNIYGDDGDDLIRMYSGTAIGGKGNDRFEFIPIAGEPWRELGVAYWTSPKGVVANLEQGWAEDGFGGRDTLVGVRRLHGSGNDDTFTGDAQDNFFHPNGGHDRIDGRGGFDGIDVREIPPNADGSGTWRAAQLSELNITVGVDGRSATISVKHYPKITYELTDIEYFRLLNDSNNYLLADFIQPQAMAQQAIAAGGSLRWNAAGPVGTPASLSFSFVTQAPADGPGATGFQPFGAAAQQAVRELLARTAEIAGLNFSEVDERSGASGQLRFGISSQAATKGVAALPNQPGAGDRAGDVWMDSDSMLDLAPGTEGYMALLHEIGHALGLRHPRNVDPGDSWPVQLRALDDRTALTVMSGTPSADGLFRSDWGPLDVLALRYLYGSRGLRSGDTSYVLGSAESNAESTLIDDGGIDTLDASALPTGVNLDLTPGHLSSVGLSAAGRVGVDNLSLPATTWIENAVGSAFDDFLLGNDLDNWLQGGPGNDWIDGGKGIDTAVFRGTRSDYEISNAFGKVYVKARDGSGGFDTLSNVERLVFDDQMLTLSTVAVSSDASFTVDEDNALARELPAPTDMARTAVGYRLVGAPAHGSATLTAQGQLAYAPAADFHGADQIVYDIAGPGGSNRYQAYIDVLPVNDGAPVGRDGSYLVIAGTAPLLHLPPATDIDNDPLSYRLLTDPGRGTARVDAGGDFVYEARAGVDASDSFGFAISDGMGGNSIYTAKIRVVAARQILQGSAGADALSGSNGTDGFVLGAGDDSATGGASDDVIDGGPGTDTAVYGGRRADFILVNSGGYWTVTDRNGAEGTDFVTAVERLQFSDRSVALDLDPGSHGGQAAQIIRGLFGAETLKVPLFCGYGVVLLDRGMRYADLVALALRTPEFWARTDDPAGHGNGAFVDSVFRNLVGRAPTAAEAHVYVDLLDSGATTQAALGTLACQSALNTGSPELMGLAGVGLDYVLPTGL